MTEASDKNTQVVETKVADNMETEGKDISENSEGDVFDHGAVIEKEESNVEVLDATDPTVSSELEVESVEDVKLAVEKILTKIKNVEKADKPLSLKTESEEFLFSAVQHN